MNNIHIIHNTINGEEREQEEEGPTGRSVLGALTLAYKEPHLQERKSRKGTGTACGLAHSE